MGKESYIKVLAVLSLALLCTQAISAYDPNARTVSNDKPREIESVGVTEHLGDKIDTSLEFTNENGETVKLSDYLDGEHPMVLTLVYYECPTLCSFHLQGLTEILGKMKWQAGDKYQFVSISIEPKETPKIALRKKLELSKKEDRPSVSSGPSHSTGPEKGWHFLTGKNESIHPLAKELGFRYKWNANMSQWAHPSVAYIITPDGRISRYLHGIQFSPETVRLSLVEATDGKVGDIVDKAVLLCFQYDPSANSYAFFAYNLMRIGGALTVLIIGVFLIRFWRKQKNEQNTQARS